MTSPTAAPALPNKRSVDGVCHQTGTGVLYGLGGFGFGGEIANAGSYPIDLNTGSPPTARPNQVHAAILGRRVAVAGEVVHLLTVGDDSQVSASVIECISVDVVAFKTISERQPEQFSMQVDRGLLSVDDLRPKDITTFENSPSPSVDDVEVNLVNNGVAAHRAIASTEGNSHRPIGHGIIKTHREPPTLGVTPPVVRSSAGVSCCPNYTTYQE